MTQTNIRLDTTNSPTCMRVQIGHHFHDDDNMLYIYYSNDDIIAYKQRHNDILVRSVARCERTSVVADIIMLEPNEEKRIDPTVFSKQLDDVMDTIVVGAWVEKRIYSM